MDVANELRERGALDEEECNVASSSVGSIPSTSSVSSRSPASLSCSDDFEIGSSHLLAAFGDLKYPAGFKHFGLFSQSGRPAQPVPSRRAPEGAQGSRSLSARALRGTNASCERDFWSNASPIGLGVATVGNASRPAPSLFEDIQLFEPSHE
jgi:hypothetical protein